jgi:alkylresorcinol/alkylpyrone synthase
MRIAAVGTALPPHENDQESLIRAFERLWGAQHANVRRVRQLHEAVQVGTRFTALPLDAYEKLRGFGDANDAFLRVGTDLGELALRRALDAAGLAPEAVTALWTVSVTGIGTPSLDARLFHRMGLRPDLKRNPIFGLGCVAGAAGLARVHDYLLAYPDEVAVLLSVELCSLTLQRDDLSVANLVASGLFGDGAAAVVCAGERAAERLGLRGPRTVATARRLYPDSLRVMGWDVGDRGFKVILDKSVPDVVRRHAREDVDGLLAPRGLARSDVAAWIAHPGGPAVIQAFEDALALPAGTLDRTRRSLRAVGNLSSASVLFVLADTLPDPTVPSGSPAVVLALGPGFGAELVLLEW